MNKTCDCCEGTNRLTPRQIVNRPGLDALVYRVGTHAAFLETMKARLSNMAVEISDADDPTKSTPDYPLRFLTTRAAYDPSIALLDAWATVGDVLTFYQERIANEGFLSTATERRSILELARLVGYALRPGVAASAFLALELDRAQDVMIQPHEIKAQSAPGPGEQAQTFENTEPLDARVAWNRLQPRLTQPQTIASIAETDPEENVRLYVKGINANLAPNDVVLITENDQPYKDKIFHIAEARPDPANDRTLVVFQEKQEPPPAPPAAAMVAGVARRYLAGMPENGHRAAATEMGRRVMEHLQVLSELAGRSDATARRLVLERIAKITEERDVAEGEQYTRLADWLTTMLQEMTARSTDRPSRAVQPEQEVDPLRGVWTRLTKRASVPPRNTFSLDRSLTRVFDKNADTGLKLASAFDARLRASLPVALGQVQAPVGKVVRAYAFRVVAPPFGHNAPLKPILGSDDLVIGHEEWPLAGKVKVEVFLTIFDGLPSAIVVSAEKDGRTHVGRAQPDLPTNTLPLGDITEVQVEIDDNKVTFSFAKLNRQYSVTWVDPSAKMTVEIGNDVTEINSGQEFEKVIDSDRIRFVLSNSGSVDDLTISNELLLPPDPLDTVALNAKYEQITPDSWAVIERPGKDNPVSREQMICTVVENRRISKADYGITGEVSQLKLNENWLYDTDRLLTVLRGTTVFAQSEELILAEEPIEKSICEEEAQTIELDAVYSGLESGRWLIVSGERDDIRDADDNPVRGVQAAELVMLAEVLQQTRGEVHEDPLPGDRTHTFIKLAKPLEYCYRRETVTIYGNVVKATHGETRRETLGSGDAAQSLQSFTLKQPPLTFVSSPTPAGHESTLRVYVNDMQWREANSLAELTKTDRKFLTKTDDDGKTTVIFGNGQRGARLPTGFENVRAVYRNGIGKPGNVRAGQISLLLSKPLGVKSVKNPLRASGGADKESRDTARKNAPLTVTALDRLVSIADYADFARTFAGIGKSVSARMTDGRRELVHVTIAGADDIPIDETSDLYRNLLKALRDFGDPHQPVMLQVRELKFIVLSANIHILPEYEWEPVVKNVRARLIDAFSFERRELGQDVLLSEVIMVIQSTRGVAYVDVDVFGSIPEKKTDRDSEGRPIRRLLTPTEIMDEAKKFMDSNNLTKRPEMQVSVNLADFEDGALRPAQLAYLTPEVADTLILNQIK